MYFLFCFCKMSFLIFAAVFIFIVISLCFVGVSIGLVFLYCLCLLSSQPQSLHLGLSYIPTFVISDIVCLYFALNFPILLMVFTVTISLGNATHYDLSSVIRHPACLKLYIFYLSNLIFLVFSIRLLTIFLWLRPLVLSCEDFGRICITLLTGSLSK